MKLSRLLALGVSLGLSWTATVASAPVGDDDSVSKAGKAVTSGGNEQLDGSKLYPRLTSSPVICGTHTNSYTTVLSAAMEFCSAIYDTNLTYGEGVYQEYDFGIMMAQYCTNTSFPETWTNGHDCLNAFMGHLWSCGPGDDAAYDGYVVEDCTTWSFNYTQPDDQSDKRDNKLTAAPHSGEHVRSRSVSLPPQDITCNFGGPTSWLPVVAHATDLFCSGFNGAIVDTVLESTYSFGTLGLRVNIPGPGGSVTVDSDKCHFAFGLLTSVCAADASSTNGGLYTFGDDLTHLFAYYLNPSASPARRGDAALSPRQETTWESYYYVYCNSGGPLASPAIVGTAAANFCSSYDGKTFDVGESRAYDFGTIGVTNTGPSSNITVSAPECEIALNYLASNCSSDGQTPGGVYALQHFWEGKEWQSLSYYFNPSGSTSKREILDPVSASDIVSVASSKRAAEVTDVTCSNGRRVSIAELQAASIEFCEHYGERTIGPNETQSLTHHLLMGGQATLMRISACSQPQLNSENCRFFFDDISSSCHANNTDQSSGGSKYTAGCLEYQIIVGSPKSNAPPALAIRDDAPYPSKTIVWPGAPILTTPPKSNAHAPSALATRQEDVTCRSGPLADPGELQAAVGSFCKHYNDMGTWPNEKLMFDYGLTDGSNATLTRSSACSRPILQSGNDCHSAFGEIVKSCQWGTEVSSGTKVTVGCITYEISIGWPIGGAMANHSASASCSSGPRAPSTDLQQAAASYCNDHYFMAVWPHEEQASNFTLAGGGKATLRRHSECAEPQQDLLVSGLAHCKMFFNWVIDTCKADNSSSGGSVDDGSGCLIYAIDVLPEETSASPAPILPRQAQPSSIVSCLRGEVASSVAIQNLTDFFCASWNGFKLPKNSTLSEQLPLPLEEGQTTAAKVNMTIHEDCPLLFNYAPICEANFQNIMADCDNGNTETAGGEYVANGCTHYKLQVLPGSSDGYA